MLPSGSVRINLQPHHLKVAFQGEKPGQETAGPSTALRSGRDDNCVAGVKYFSLKLLRHERIVIPTGAKRSGGTCGFLRATLSHSQLKRNHSPLRQRNLRPVAADSNGKRRRLDLVRTMECIAGSHIRVGQNAASAFNDTSASKPNVSGNCRLQ